MTLSPERGRSTSFNVQTLDNVAKTVPKVNRPFTYKNSNNLTRIKFLYTNAGSLDNKWSQFKSLVNHLNRPHVILVTETWFNHKTLTALEGYNMFNKDRQVVRGGGVVIYVRNDLRSLVVTELSTDGEIAWCNINFGEEVLLVGCMYRPPHSSVDTNKALLKAIAQAKALCDKKRNTGLIIAGDFNHSDILWSDNCGTFTKKGRSSSIDLVNCLTDNELTQLVNEPTFGNNTLDLVITNDPVRIYQITHGPPIVSTKKNRLHCTLTWDYTLRTDKKTCEALIKKNLNRGNYEKFSKLMSKTLYLGGNSDEAYNQLQLMYQEAEDECIPVIKPSSRGKQNPMWFNKTIRKLTAKKYEFWHIWRNSGSKHMDLKLLYRQSCIEVKRAVKDAKLCFETALVAKSKANPKLLYSYINNQKSCRDIIRMLKRTDGTLTTDEFEIVNILNEQFCRVFNDPVSSVPKVNSNVSVIKKQCSTCPSELFSAPKVTKMLGNINCRKSAGPDGIHPMVLNKCKNEFGVILSRIFQLSFSTGNVPAQWKEANITPIHKKGEKIDPENYRAISLTAVPCKLMERMVRDIMMEHLYSNELIAKEQHGFVLSKSCLTNLLETMDIVTDAYNKDYQSLIVFLDFQKAFDKVCHASLLYKLENFGFNQTILDWIRSYLEKRRQRVVIGRNYSDWRPVTSGVPQGSVLGPLLFVLFINDMPSVVGHIIKLFADDSKLIGVVRNNSDIQLIQKDLDALVQWAKNWRMLFHPNKCKIMDISKKNTVRHQFTMEKANSTERHTLEYTEVERDLGVMISSNLKPEHQITNAVSKANRALSTLRRTFSCWTPRNFRILYAVYVRPHLEYAATAWSPYYKKDIAMIEKVQRRATKLVKAFKNLDYAERLEKLKLTTLEERRLRGDLIQFFKFYSGINIINWKIAPRTINQIGTIRRKSNSHNIHFIQKNKNF